MGMPPKAAILDVDGTLIDSNEAHAQAWVDVGRELGYPVQYVVVRTLVGMGGDKVMPRVTGLDNDSAEAERVRKRRGEIFRERYLPRLQPFPRTRELLERMRAQGLVLAVARSASEKDLQALLRQAGVDDLVQARTSSSDVDESKPAPDAVQAALASAGCAPGEAIMIGDTPYDVQAAQRAGVPVIALRCGGWGDRDLEGALAVFADPADLLAHYEGSPLSNGRAEAGPVV
ncbi:MAG TPA: HAD family hydrolase [Longimicrobiales bacterium]